MRNFQPPLKLGMDKSLYNTWYEDVFIYSLHSLNAGLAYICW